MFHNIVTVNGSQLNFRGYSKFELWGENKGNMYASTDLSDQYFGAFDSYIRSYAIKKDSSAVVRDEFRAADQAVKVRWAVITDAAVEQTADCEVLLTKQGKRLRLRAKTSLKGKFNVSNAEFIDYYKKFPEGCRIISFEFELQPTAKADFSAIYTPCKGRYKHRSVL